STHATARRSGYAHRLRPESRAKRKEKERIQSPDSPMKRFRLPALIAIAIASASTWLISNSRASTETPDYKEVRTDEKFEIRDYSALTVATTSMAGSGMNGSFGELLGFSSGKNESSEKIAMTAPVLIDTTKE